jgi:hypothetical protein
MDAASYRCDTESFKTTDCMESITGLVEERCAKDLRLLAENQPGGFSPLYLHDHGGQDYAQDQAYHEALDSAHSLQSPFSPKIFFCPRIHLCTQEMFRMMC